MRTTPATIFTKTDLLLARIYQPLLIEVAKNNGEVTYGDLVKRAKKRHPEIQQVAAALAISTGRRLEAVRLFTDAQGLPDLTSIVINSVSKECGTGYTRVFDPSAARAKVYAYDWGNAKENEKFESFLCGAEQTLVPLQKRTKSEAATLCYEYYRQNKKDLPADISSERDAILDLLQEGLDPAEAFASSIDSLRKKKDDHP